MSTLNQILISSPESGANLTRNYLHKHTQKRHSKASQVDIQFAIIGIAFAFY
jgi:hypothetical protein